MNIILFAIILIPSIIHSTLIPDISDPLAIKKQPHLELPTGTFETTMSNQECVFFNLSETERMNDQCIAEIIARAQKDERSACFVAVPDSASNQENIMYIFEGNYFFQYLDQAKKNIYRDQKTKKIVNPITNPCTGNVLKRFHTIFVTLNKQKKCIVDYKETINFLEDKKIRDKKLERVEIHRLANFPLNNRKLSIELNSSHPASTVDKQMQVLENQQKLVSIWQEEKNYHKMIPLLKKIIHNPYSPQENIEKASLMIGKCYLFGRKSSADLKIATIFFTLLAQSDTPQKSIAEKYLAMIKAIEALP